MTDVIDDALTWEQRREIRRKKRQELLAEADRIVKTNDQVSSSQRSYTQSVDDENFEQERQRRRREREEKRRKEREELEKQLRDEDDARAERERRREERRRQREESDTIITRYSANESQHEKEESVEVATEESGQIESEDLNQYESQHDGNPDEEDANEEVATAEVETVEQSEVSVTIASTNREVDEDDSISQELNGETEDEKDNIGEEESHVSEPPESEDAEENSAAEILKEKRRERERQRMEEEEQEKEEAERRRAEREAKQQREKEERMKRMAEGEAKRKQLTKQTSTEAKELTAKGNATTTVLMKMKDLNEKMSDSPKAHKEKPDTGVAKLSSLDDRLKSYKSKAERQDTVKKTSTPRTGRSDVANRLSMWETGKVATPDKTPKKASDTVVVKQSAGVSSRKNLWETGKVTTSAEKKSTRAEIHGANFASRKNMWLKATQETTKSGGKPDDTQVIKTGVMTRLNKWEKGEVTGSTTTPKQKASHLPPSDVSNRRSKWENISHDTPTQQSKKNPVVHTLITTEVSSRKTMYESKAESKDRKDSIDVEEQEAVQPLGQTTTEMKRKDSLSSGVSDDDDQVLSDDSDEGQNGQQLELDSADSDRD